MSAGGLGPRVFGGSRSAGGGIGGGVNPGALQLNVKDMLLANEEEGGMMPYIPSFGFGASNGFGFGKPRSRYLDFYMKPRNPSDIFGGAGCAGGSDDAGGSGGDAGGSGSDGARADSGSGGAVAEAALGGAGGEGNGGYLPGQGAVMSPLPPSLPFAPLLANVSLDMSDASEPSPELLAVKQNTFVSYVSN